MIKIIAAMILAVGILVACDNGPTGPTPTGGAIRLEIFLHATDNAKNTGEGYNFANCEKFKISNSEAYRGLLGKNHDLDAFYEMALGPGPRDAYIYAIPQRITGLETGHRYNCLVLADRENIEFELLTLDGKGRNKIYAEYRCLGPRYIGKRRIGITGQVLIRYKLLDN